MFWGLENRFLYNFWHETPDQEVFKGYLLSTLSHFPFSDIKKTDYERLWREVDRVIFGKNFWVKWKNVLEKTFKITKLKKFWKWKFSKLQDIYIGPSPIGQSIDRSLSFSKLKCRRSKSDWMKENSELLRSLIWFNPCLNIFHIFDNK